MGRARRRVELRPDDFDVDTVYEGHNSVRRALTVEIQKLPRGAYARVCDRLDLQAEDRAIRIAERAHQPNGADLAQLAAADRRLGRRLQTGKVDDDVDYSAYVLRLIRQMETAETHVARHTRTREFVSLLDMAAAPPSIERVTQAYLAEMDHDDVIQFCRGYLASQAADHCPPGTLLRALLRHSPAARTTTTGHEVMLLLASPALAYRHHADFFKTLPGCATVLLELLDKYEADHPGQHAPADWMRPSDIGVFCHALSGGGTVRVRGVRADTGAPRTEMADVPRIDRPEIAPLANEAFEELARLISYMPTRRARNRFKRTRMNSIIAIRQASIVKEETPAEDAPIFHRPRRPRAQGAPTRRYKRAKKATL